jgi:pyruvate kinase
MAARAECVMLNKGPWLFEAIEMLDALFARMAGHLHKKSHLLRPLRSW